MGTWPAPFMCQAKGSMPRPGNARTSQPASGWLDNRSGHPTGPGLYAGPLTAVYGAETGRWARSRTCPADPSVPPDGVRGFRWVMTGRADEDEWVAITRCATFAQVNSGVHGASCI